MAHAPWRESAKVGVFEAGISAAWGPCSLGTLDDPQEQHGPVGSHLPAGNRPWSRSRGSCYCKTLLIMTPWVSMRRPCLSHLSTGGGGEQEGTGEVMGGEQAEVGRI